MYDKLFGKICLDRGWVRRSELEAAIRVREQLRSLGMDRRLGEILVSQGRITEEQAEAAIQEQHRQTDPGKGDIVLGQLAVQNGLINEAQLQSALEKQRDAHQRDRAAPTLGYLLVEDGYLTVQQLDALISLQGRIQSRSTQRLNSLMEEIAWDSATPLAYIVQSRDADEAGAGRGAEQLLTAPGVRAKIEQGVLDENVVVRRADEATARRIGEYPEFGPALTNRRRRETLQRTVASRQTQLRRRRRGWLRVGLCALVGAGLVGSFAFGSWLSEPGEPARDADPLWSPRDITGLVSPPDTVAATDPLGTPPDTGSPTGGAGRDTQAETVFLQALGLVRTPDLMGITRWLPAEEAAQLRAWRARPAEERARVQPFETPDGLVVGRPSERGVRFEDGSEIVMPAAEVERQTRLWADVREIILPWRDALDAREPAGPVDDVAPLVRLARTLAEQGWPTYARRILVDAFRLAPNDRHVRDGLGYLLPGEDPREPTQARLLPVPPRPDFPAPPPLSPPAVDPSLMPGMLGAADGEWQPPLPWIHLVPPLRAEDMIGPLPLVPDPEAQRRDVGEVAYLGYWLPREALARWWPDASRPSRFVLRPGQAEVWTDLPQFRGEVLSAAGRLYSLMTTYLTQHGANFAAFAEFENLALRVAPCRLVIVGPGEGAPAWVERAVPGEWQLVVATDLRSPEALVVPIARGIARAALRSTFGTAAPEWLQEAWARELAYDFAAAHDLAVWPHLERALDLDRLATLPAAAPPPAFFTGPMHSERDRAMAWALWSGLPSDRLAPLIKAVRTDNREALARASERLLAWGNGQPENVWRKALAEVIRRESHEVRRHLPVGASGLRALTPAHLRVARQLDPAGGAFFSDVVGADAVHDPSGATPPIGHALPLAGVERVAMSRYTMRELITLAGLGARLRLLRTPDAERSVAWRTDLEAAFRRAELPAWVSWLSEYTANERSEPAPRTDTQ